MKYCAPEIYTGSSQCHRVIEELAVFEGTISLVSWYLGVQILRGYQITVTLQKVHSMELAVVDVTWNTSSRWGALVEHLQERLSENCLLYTSPSPRDATLSRMPSSA